MPQICATAAPIRLGSSNAPGRTGRMTVIGATLSFPRVPTKVPSPSDLPTFVIVHCQLWFVEFTTDVLASRLRASRI
jgi:hypothetical protein